MTSAKRLVFSLFVVAGMSAAGLAAPPPATATGPDLTVGLKASNIDLAACKAWVDGKEVEGDFQKGILATLGLAAGNPWAAIHYSKWQEAKEIRYLVVFKRPVTFGSLLFQKDGRLAYLKPGAKLPADPAQTNDWIEVTFPPHQSGWRLATVAGESQAFLCTVKNDAYGWFPFTFLRLMKPRLHNIVPEGVANGEAEYVQYSQFSPPNFFKASNIVAGAGRWQSHGPDKTGRVPRPPVSDIDPTWFVVSWDEPRAISGILLDSNFEKFKVYSYQGPPGINPAVAGPQDWKRIRQEPRADGNAAWITFPPITTRGLRFVAEATKSTGGPGGTARCGAIGSLQVFTDLGIAPVPNRVVVGEAPPLAITLNLPEKGIVSMAVDGTDGRRVRNFPARLEMGAGEHAVGWDLKDEAGGFVSPGSYTWKAITHPGLELEYQMTPYPNVEMVAKENSPWLNGPGGSGGWLADHTPPRAVCAAGDGRVFLAAQMCESGVALIECDLEGRKHWGHGNMIAWTGPAFLASDGEAVYAMPTVSGGYQFKGLVDYVWRFALPEKKLETPFTLEATATRQRGVSGLAVRDGRLYVAVNAQDDWLENAFDPGIVDQDHCEPKYPKPLKADPYAPDRREDFLRLLRLTRSPAGQDLIHLETAKQPAARQHIVVALEQESPVGSFVFPLPETKDLQMIISVLKPGAAYPPNPNREADWVRVYAGKGKGWTVVPAPEKTVTRGIRLSFDKGLDDLDEALVGDEGEAGLDGGLGLGDEADGADSKAKNKSAWFAQLEGMKILRRRFEGLFPTCKVTVNSGTVTPEGEWDAKREVPLTEKNPGIYMMEWPAPQPIRGLAIKEVDGRFTEIDAWTGDGTPDMKAEKGWEKLATYEQTLRSYYHPDKQYNHAARYMDGYVDFGRDVTTRAIRLRVTEQWLTGGERPHGVRSDRGGMTLDPARCRVYGVTPLKGLGGEPPTDILATQRIEVYDLATKKLVKEIPFPEGSDIAFAPDGALHGISAGKVVRIDAENGEHVPLPLDVQRPTAIAFGKAGELFVFDAATDQRVIRVFDPAGKPLRTIGTPGGRIVGPYDPTRFTTSPGVAVDLAVDGKDQLWVVECDWSPKRVSLWGVDGTFKKDMLGNTNYGGGGWLDPFDKSRLYYQGLEFALDWKTGGTALKNILWQGKAPAGEQAIKVGDRRYLVTRPQFNVQPAGVVYLHEKDRLRCMAAVGQAGGFAMLKTPEILEKLGRKALGGVDFTWSDRSGDGAPQADEVEFFEAKEMRAAVGRFDETLGVDAAGFRYEVKEILANGAPVYERKKKPFDSRVVRMDDGRFFVVGDNERMAAVDADGKTSWTHPVEGWGVHAIAGAKTPWYPGQAVAQFDVIGHETATVGDLGEFFVTNGNCGTWHVWTADGLLAGRIFRDLLGSPVKKPWSMAEHERGLDLTDVSAGQEHFGGSFCKTSEDGRFYVVAGHNHASVVEVQGFEKFKRLGGTVTVTQKDVDAAMEWDRKVQARKLYEAAKAVECRRRKGGITVDGDPAEWEFTTASLDGRDAALAMAYDDASLYVCFTVNGSGPLKNTGNDWKRLFKTGAAVDLQIGVDPKADVQRKIPAAGDCRLLMTMTGEGPTAVLYQPTAPSAKPEEAWEARTGVAQSGFDRVVKLPEVRMATRADKTGYCAEAAIPLKAIGLSIVPDAACKFDWGILVSGPDGSEVIERLYWANPQTRMLSDEAIEARLHPDLWGTLRFAAGSGRKAQPDLDMENKPGGDDDFELDPDEE